MNLTQKIEQNIIEEPKLTTERYKYWRVNMNKPNLFPKLDKTDGPIAGYYIRTIQIFLEELGIPIENFNQWMKGQTVGVGDFIYLNDLRAFMSR